MTTVTSYDEKMAENLTLLAAAATIITIKKRRRQPDGRRGKLWCHQWLSARSSERGMQHFVLNELSVSDANGFHSFLRMTPETYNELLRLVEPAISGNDTFMRDCITAHEKLVVTLRYLSSGTFRVYSVTHIQSIRP